MALGVSGRLIRATGKGGSPCSDARGLKNTEICGRDLSPDGVDINWETEKKKNSLEQSSTRYSIGGGRAQREDENERRAS